MAPRRKASEVEKARPSGQQTAASQEYGWSLDWNYSQASTGLIAPLFGRQLLQELALMADTDETVGAMMWCICSTMAQVEWKHVPQVNGEDDETDPDAVKMADFANTLLLDMGRSFGDHVDDAMAMVWAGFAPCEIITKQRTAASSRFADQYWGIADLKLRDPLSIYWWVYDQTRRNVIGARQSTFQGAATIPMWKMNFYRTTTAADRPSGRSLLTNAHRIWRLKNRIQDSEAIGIERELCGLPLFRIPQADLDTGNEKDGDGNYTTQAKAAQARIQSAMQAVQNLRLNKSGGLVLPSDTYASDDDEVKDNTPKYDFKIVTSAGQRSIDAGSAIGRYDVGIARTALMQFLHLGGKSSGASYALSEDQSAMAIRALMALALKVADEWNRKTLTLLWSINNFDPRTKPALRPSSISKDGIAALGQFFGGLAKIDWLVATDKVARTGMLKAAGVPYDPAAQGEAATEAAKPPPPPPAPFGAPPPNEEEDDGQNGPGPATAGDHPPGD